jgi:hypothetical protein
MLLALPGAAESFVWVDEAGVTHITNDPERVPEPVRDAPHDPESLRSIWDGPVDAPAPPATAASTGRGAHARACRAAGRRPPARRERARGGRAARHPARAAGPARAALVPRAARPLPRRYDSAAQHLEAFLATAGDELEPWRATARARLAALADERRLERDAAA